MKPSDYERLILRHNAESLEVELTTSRAYLRSIEARISAQLVDNEALYSVRIGERIRTVMTWYTRESFRYGTHSRPSMLYARLDLDRIIEALVVGFVISHRIEDGEAFGRLDRISKHVLRLLGLHEVHVNRLLHEDGDFSLARYGSDLDEERTRLLGRPPAEL